MAETTTDQRRVRGDRSRASIAHRAAEIASLEGLTGLTIGGLASDLGISKSNIATLFGTKENLQVAAVASARATFVEVVVAPALAEPRGMPRLRVLLDRWFEYLSGPTMPGGCFRSATLAEFDSKPGPVRDALIDDQRDLRKLLAREIRRAQEHGHAVGEDPEALAFHIDALMCATNTALRLSDPDAVTRTRALLARLLNCL